MKSRSWILMLFMIVCLGGWLTWSYVNSPPTEEIAQAEKAVYSARVSAADVYATAYFNAATDALANAKAKLKTEAYSAAKAAALDAQAKAVMAKANAEAAQKAQQWAALQTAELKLATLKDNQVAVKVAAMKLSAKLKGKKADDLNREVMDLEAALAMAQGQIDKQNAALDMAAQQQIDERNAADVRLVLVELDGTHTRQNNLKTRLGLAINAWEPPILTAGMGTITGTVKFTKEDDAPRVTQLMKGVMVGPNDGIKDVDISLLTSNTYSATTNNEGSFSLLNVSPGTYKIQCSHPQLGKQDVKVTVIADRLVKVHFSYFHTSR